MTVYALISPGGSPGVTTTAMALALTWPRPVILAECDPAGGSVLAGFLAGRLEFNRGLLTFAAAQGGPDEDLAGHLVNLDQAGTSRLLAGIRDPRQAAALSDMWRVLAGAFHQVGSAGIDVLADCGRLDGSPDQPIRVLAEAAAVAIVLRPLLRQVAAARSRVAMLAELRPSVGVPSAFGTGLLVLGDGPLRANDIAQALGSPLAGRLNNDPSTAKLLSDGAGRSGRLASRPLMREARLAGRALRGLAATSTEAPSLAVPETRT